MAKKRFIFSYLLVSIGGMQAQDTLSFAVPKEKPRYWLAVSGQTGHVFNPVGEQGKAVLDGTHYRSVTLRLGRQSQVDDLYGRLYRMPTFGVGLHFTNFNNSTIGNPKALFSYFEIPFTMPRAGQKFSFGYTGGLGIAWDFVTHKQLEINSRNSNGVPQSLGFIGSNVNCFVDLSLFADYHITDYLHVGLTVGYQHTSNGAFRKPNKGYNIVPVGVTAKYQLGEHTPMPQFHPLPRPEFIANWCINAKTSFGYKQNSINTPYYWKGVVGVNALYQAFYRYRFGMGFDMHLAMGEKDPDGNAARAWRDTGKEIFTPAVVACWEWVLMPGIVLPIDLGVYLTKNDRNDNEITRYYESVGIKGYLTNHLWLGVSVKAHRGRADYFQWGIGYTFEKI